MGDQSEGRKIARNGEAGIHRLLVDDELVMVPAQPGIDRPIAQSNQVLHKRRLLQVRPLALARIGPWEAERQGRVVVKLRGVGDDVIEILVQESIVRFDADLPFIPAVVDREHSLEIQLVKPVVLKQNDRSGQGIGIKVVGVVAHHAAKIADHIGREDVPVGGNGHGLEVVGILPLARRSLGLARRIAPSLLHDLVGNLVARQRVAHDEIDAVVRRQIALIVCGEIADGSAVGVVLRYYGIEIVVRLRRRAAEAENILAPRYCPCAKFPALL